MLDTKTKIIIAKKIELFDFAGDDALMDFETGNYYELKGSAGTIWEHIKSGITVAELINALMKDFEIDADTCLSEISAFLSQLEAQEFLELQA